MGIYSSLSTNKRKELRRVVFSSMIGNALEWYDFALYGYFSTLIARLFFPSADLVASLLATYGAFGAGFVMRPLGGFIFGALGDKKGRKKALLWSIHLMSIPTLLIGCLPTYEVVGWWAPFALTIIRLLQGLSMGGEFTGSIVFIVEHAPREQRGFWGSFAPFSALLGILVGSGFSAILSTALSSEQLASWGWRLPFMLSLAGGWLGTYMRKNLGETSAFQKKEKPAQSITSMLFKKHQRAMWTVFLIDFLVAIGFYLIVTFLSGYFEQFIGFTRAEALFINTCGMLTFTAFIPLTGFFLDRFGRKPLMLAAALGFAVLAVPIFYGFTWKSIGLTLGGHMIFGSLMGVYFAALPAVLVESFPANVRYSGISIAHNLSMALLGGSTPFLLTLLIDQTGSLIAPSFYLLTGALFALAGLFLLKDRTKKPLEDFALQQELRPPQYTQGTKNIMRARP